MQLGNRRSAGLVRAGVLTLAVALGIAQGAVGQTAEDAALKKAEAAVAKAAADKAAAEKALAATIEAEKAALAEIAAAKVAAIKATARKAATADVAARKAALDKVAAEVAAKDAERIKAFTDKAISDKVARDTAAVERTQGEKADAEKALAEKTAALDGAKAEGAAAADAAKAAPDDKDLAQKGVAAKLAQDRAERDLANANNTLRSVEVTLRAVTAELAAAKDGLEKMNAPIAGETPKDANAARQATQAIETFKTIALTQAVDQEKVNHELAVAAKTNAERTQVQRAAATKGATDKLALAKSGAEKAAAAKAAAEKVANDRAAIAAAAQEKATNSQAAPDKTAAEKAVEEKTLADTTLADRVAAEQAANTALAAATAAVDGALADEKNLADELARFDGQIKESLARYYEAVAIVEGGLAPLPADQWDYAKARHLLCRAGFGGTPEEVERLHAMGLHAAVEFLVDFDQRPALNLPFHSNFPEPTIRNENRLASTRQRQLTDRRRAADARQQNELRDWWIQRMVQSERPLQEKLVLFWHGHFATEYQIVRDSYALARQNELLRAHGAGNFGALLHGIVQDPAMLRYLDNNSNVKGRPNENLAREIMELFSMGEGNYTEEDVMEGARALTGYTYDNATRQFRFVVSRHDTENKTIFGRTGNFAGDDFVDLILQQPFTAPFIAKKQFVFFAHENPSDEAVMRLASILRGHQYDLRPMLKNLFMSAEFYGGDAMASQIKSPVQLVVGTLRDLGIKEVSFSTLGPGVAAMGQELYGPPNVKGWEGGEFWVNANRIFIRYNGIADLLENIVVPNQPRGLDIVGALEGRKFETPQEVVEYLAKSCLTCPLSEDKQKLLADQIASLPPSSEWPSQRNQVNARLRMLLVLLMSMPEYQCT